MVVERWRGGQKDAEARAAPLVPAASLEVVGIVGVIFASSGGPRRAIGELRAKLGSGGAGGGSEREEEASGVQKLAREGRLI